MRLKKLELYGFPVIRFLLFSRCPLLAKCRFIRYTLHDFPKDDEVFS